jgi:hypothetical protein
MSLTGDVYADLLKAAAEIVEPRASVLALYKGKVVEVLEKDGLNFSKVNYQGDEAHRIFSAPNKDLKPYGLNTVEFKPDLNARKSPPPIKVSKHTLRVLAVSFGSRLRSSKFPTFECKLRPIPSAVSRHKRKSTFDLTVNM